MNTYRERYIHCNGIYNSKNWKNYMPNYKRMFTQMNFSAEILLSLKICP